MFLFADSSSVDVLYTVQCTLKNHNGKFPGILGLGSSMYMVQLPCKTLQVKATGDCVNDALLNYTSSATWTVSAYRNPLAQASLVKLMTVGLSII